MSFHGGGRVFLAVAKAVEQREAGEISVKDLIGVLARSLKAEDWSIHEAMLGSFPMDSPVREAMRELGVVEPCLTWHSTEPWECDEEAGHYPQTPHKDSRGPSWMEDSRPEERPE